MGEMTIVTSGAPWPSRFKRHIRHTYADFDGISQSTAGRINPAIRDESPLPLRTKASPGGVLETSTWVRTTGVLITAESSPNCGLEWNRSRCRDDIDATIRAPLAHSNERRVSGLDSATVQLAGGAPAHADEDLGEPLRHSSERWMGTAPRPRPGTGSHAAATRSRKGGTGNDRSSQRRRRISFCSSKGSQNRNVRGARGTAIGGLAQVRCT